MKKSIYLIILSLLSILSCSSEGEEEVKKEFQYFYETESVVFINDSNNKTSRESEYEIKTEISSNKPLDFGSDFNTFIKYIKQTKPDIEINILLNDASVLLINVENGMLTKQDPNYPNSGLCPECNHDSNGNISDSTECSQKGVKHCAYAVYQQWSTAQIIYESITGGAQQVLLDCGIRNCLGWG